MRFLQAIGLIGLISPFGVSASFDLAGARSGAEQSSAAKAPTPPSKDAFYKAPKGFAKASPGDILRHRPVPNPLLVGPTLNTGYYSAAYQILYRTTNGLGQPSVALTTLIVPNKPDPLRLVAYQTFYDAADVDCSPSYTLQQGQSNTNIEGVLISSLLRQGWYVTVSDYEGPHAAFTVGKQAGHATLDAIRATLASRSFSKISKTPNVGLYGYSGGALASEWAVELQPKYAPELEIVGAAFGGLTPNVTNVILTVNGQPNSNLIPTGILGFANQYQNVSSFLKQNLIPKTAAAFNHPLTHCSNSALSNKNIFKYFKTGASALSAPIFTSVVNQNGIMGLTNTPTVPLYIFKSVGDEVSPIADTDALVKKYCAAGANIAYQRNKFGTHETEGILGLPHGYTWLKQRLNGQKPPAGCSTQTINQKKLQPHAKRILGNTVYQELKAELGSFES